jgi:hypothetical protein
MTDFFIGPYFLILLALAIEGVNLWIYICTPHSGFPILSILLALTAAYTAHSWPFPLRVLVVVVITVIHFCSAHVLRKFNLFYRDLHPR